MAHNPAFYHQILQDVFKGEKENEPANEPDDRAKARWRLSYSLLRHFSTIPGLTPAGIDVHALRSWIDQVRELGRETDRIAVTESNIGRLLAHSPHKTPTAVGRTVACVTKSSECNRWNLSAVSKLSATTCVACLGKRCSKVETKSDN